MSFRRDFTCYFLGFLTYFLYQSAINYINSSNNNKTNNDGAFSKNIFKNVLKNVHRNNPSNKSNDIIPMIPFGESDWRPDSLLSHVTVASTEFARCEIHTVKTEKGIIKDKWIWLDELSHVSMLVHSNITNKYLLFYQSKYGIEGKSFMSIGGYFNKGENSKQCAQRELLEETGLQSDELILLGKYRSKSNRGGGFVYSYIAKNSYPSKKKLFSDDTEYHSKHWFTKEELVDITLDNKIRFAPCQLTVALSLAYLNKNSSIRALHSNYTNY